MHRAQAEKELAALGFEIDWSCSGPGESGIWSGVIDAIGKVAISGDCFGPCVSGDNASDFYKSCIEEAKAHAGALSPCANENCEFHNSTE